MSDNNYLLLLVLNDNLEAGKLNIELEKLGYKVLVANTGKDALEIISRNKSIDLILIDTDLGEDISGIETAELILRASNLPIVFFLSKPDSNNINKTHSVPVYGYFAISSNIAIADATIRTAIRLYKSDKNHLEHKRPFENTISDFKQTIQSLQTKLLFLEALANSSYDGILVIDENGHKILQNRRTQELWKIPQDIIDDPDGMKQVHHVMHMVKNPEKFINEINYQKEHPDEITKDELILIDGSVLERYSSPVYGENRQHFGRIYTFHDITKRIQYENTIQSLLQEKELLLKEVHHRIKNNMNTIMSLLTLQAASLDEQTGINVLNDAANRIHSMVILYDQLYKSMNYEEISAKDYLGDLIDKVIEIFPKAIPIHVTKDIEDIALKVNKLQPLGIIVNELLTNIMKYAFNGRESGTIKICFYTKRKDTTEKPLMCLEIQDNGNGIPESIDFDNSSGFGLMLVGILTKQIEGTASIERGAGSTITIDFVK